VDVDVDEVIKCVSLLGNATAAGKVGFFLESRQRELGVSNRQLEELSQYRPRYSATAKGAPGIVSSPSLAGT